MMAFSSLIKTVFLGFVFVGFPASGMETMWMLTSWQTKSTEFLPAEGRMRGFGDFACAVEEIVPGRPKNALINREMKCRKGGTEFMVSISCGPEWVKDSVELELVTGNKGSDNEIIMFACEFCKETCLQDFPMPIPKRFKRHPGD